MKTVVTIVFALLLSACGLSQDTSAVDQCLRVELFNSCMKNLPAAPVATQYNDWDEVVDSCGSQSYYQALRARKFIKAECLP